MPSNTPPEVICGHVVFPLMPVSDVTAAVDYYTQQLGFKLGFTWGDPPRFAGVNLGEVSMHLSSNDPEAPSSSAYFVVGDAEELFDFHKARGVTIENQRRIGITAYGITGSGIPGAMNWGLDIIYIV